MRLVNAVLGVLVIVGGTMTLVQHLDDWARTLGGLLGIAFWGAPFYLAWRGLAPDSTLRMVRRARLASIVVGGLWILFVILIGVFFGNAARGESYVSLMLVLLIFGIPFALNVKALGKRKAELEQTKTVQAAEHIDAHLAPDVAAAVSTVAVSSPPSAPILSSNYFARHWRGDLSLGISYWVNGTLIAGVLPLTVIAVLSEYSKQAESLRLIAVTYVLAVVIALISWLWGVVGIWRSSDNHVARGGQNSYAVLAKLAVVLGMFGVVANSINTYVPMLKDMTLIAIGEDPLGSYKVTFLSDGKALFVKGMLREGSAMDIERLLDSAPAVTTLVLSSNGGRLLEGKLLAMAVRKRALDTYVEDICLSTCTFVFLAGKERAATPNAKIGFHTPHFPSADPEIRQEGIRFMMEVYRNAGLPNRFLDQVRNTPATTMWYPTRSELIDAGVITRISLGGETTTAFTRVSSKKELLLALRDAPLWVSIETRFPDLVLRAVEQGWKVKGQGGNDNQISTAMRSVIAQLIPVLLRESSIKSLETYVTLSLDQMRAARAISYEACHQLLNAQLNPIDVFPKELRNREERWMLDALNSQPNPGRQYSKRAVEKALVAAYSRLPPPYMDAVTNPEKYQQRPDLVCDGLIATFEAVNSLSPNERAAALEGMFKEGA